MRPDDIRELLRREPFRPFRLVMTDGVGFEIRHPEMAHMLRSTVRLVLREGSLSQPGEAVIIAVLLHVIRVELIEAPASPSAI